MTDRRRLTWRQTFFKRVVSLSMAGCFFSLLSEQWWRERSADGIVIEVQIMRVQGPVVAGGLLDEYISSLWDVEVVGLITCERIVLGQGAKVLIRKSAQGSCPHMEDEDNQENEKEDEREYGKQREEGRVVESQATHNMQMAHVWNAAPHTLFLSQCQCDIKSVVNQRENVTCEVCCSQELKWKMSESGVPPWKMRPKECWNTWRTVKMWKWGSVNWKNNWKRP